MVNEHQIETARKNWKKASIELNFEIISPFTINIKGVNENIFAFLPKYGSPNGMVIELISAPEFKPDKNFIKWTELNNCYSSLINVELYLIYDIEYFKEVLADWGHF